MLRDHAAMNAPLQAIDSHRAELRACRDCPRMQGPPVLGRALASPVMLVGQAPGSKEIECDRPFAWTAGKTLFQWFGRIGVTEEGFRARVHMAAVCRCFPGKRPNGGDRVPDPKEIDRCARWLEAEMRLLRPRLILPVGKLAIGRFLRFSKLTEVVGAVHRFDLDGRPADLIPLPHPSGVSTWHRREPGKALLASALGLIDTHPAWRAIVEHGA